VSDLCGEKLAETFVTRAIDAACASCGFTHVSPCSRRTRMRGPLELHLFVRR
jgi:hypothetical protein